MEGNLGKWKEERKNEKKKKKRKKGREYNEMEKKGK